MRIIIKAVKERKDFIEYLKINLPSAEWCFDEKKCAFDTFLRALKMANNEPCLHLEEDILITKDFEKKAKKVITQKPFNLIQFFSMRKADVDKKSRWDRNFLMNQCFYAPPNYSRLILEYYNTWSKVKLQEHPNGTDQMVCDFLKSRKEKYWISVPSLVQHRISVSMIDKRRGSTNRQSQTFVDGI